MKAAAESPFPHRRTPRLVDLRGKPPDGELAQFFLEERFRRSFSLTGYLLSGGGAGAGTCWFLIGSLYANAAPPVVLRSLIVASALFLAAVVLGFVAALASFKAFEVATLLPAEDFSRPYNRADGWMAATMATRIGAATLIAAGGIVAFAAYVHLAWR